MPNGCDNSNKDVDISPNVNSVNTEKGVGALKRPVVT